jgi:hypothetical protein
VALEFFEREPKGVGNRSFRRLILRWVGFTFGTDRAAKPISFKGFTRCQCSRGPLRLLDVHSRSLRSKQIAQFGSIGAPPVPDFLGARQRALSEQVKNGPLRSPQLGGDCSTTPRDIKGREALLCFHVFDLGHSGHPRFTLTKYRSCIWVDKKL